MKFIVATLMLAFTVGFASPSFAFDLLDDIVEKADELGKKAGELLPDPDVLKERANEVIEQGAADAEVAAKAQTVADELRAAAAETQAEIMAEFENTTRKSKSRLLKLLALPMEPENHCEVAKAVLAMRASGYLFLIKKINVGDLSSFDISDAKDDLESAVKETAALATIKMAVCENYY